MPSTETREMVVGHYWRQIILLSLPIYLINAMIGGLMEILSTAIFFTVTMVSKPYNHHLENVLTCDRCAKYVWTLDGDAEAERHAWSLWYMHWRVQGPIRFFLPTLGFIISLALVIFLTVSPVLFYVIAGVLDLVQTRADYYHHVLRRWCPHCKRGGGGDDEDVPVPGPQPVNEAKL